MQTKVKIPLLKNCRVDYKSYNGSNWSILVDYMTGNNLMIQAGIHSLNVMWQHFKFCAKNELPIDNYPVFSLPLIHKIEGVKYQY